jgi:riboflavin biosynthesis pyrimidine reductase
MSDPARLELLVSSVRGPELPLPPRLRKFAGRFRWPPGNRGRPRVVANFASTLDGVVSIDPRDPAGGGEITGHDRGDRAMMGILRAVADAVVVGAGTLRAVPKHRWTAAQIFPEWRAEYRDLRARVGRREPNPLNVIVTARGDLDVRAPVFHTEGLEALVVTTRRGAARIAKASPPPALRVAVDGPSRSVSAAGVLRAIREARPSRAILIEGGPHLFGTFLEERCLDELYLTVAPQISGRNGGPGRLGLVMGRTFAPARPLWARLAEAKRGGDLLFLRYDLRAPRRSR